MICAVMQNPRMRTVTNYFIVNMACADGLYTLVTTPPTFLKIFNYQHWATSSRGLGIFFCKVINFTQFLLISASVLTLAAIAFDRFFAIMMPLKRIINKRAFNWILVFVWLASFAVATPLLYSIRVVEFNGTFTCEENWAPAFDDETSPQIYSLVLFVVVFCIPLSAITVLYTIICHHLWRIKTPGETEGEMMLEKRRNSRKKVVKMLITVVVVFIVSWLPLQIATFLVFFKGVEISESFYFACEIFMAVSCALNPAVYAVFSENYRHSFKKTLNKCCFCNVPGIRRYRAPSSSLPHQTAPTILRSDPGSMKSCSQKAAYLHLNGEEEHKL